MVFSMLSKTVLKNNFQKHEPNIKRVGLVLVFEKPFSVLKNKENMEKNKFGSHIFFVLKNTDHT